MPDPHQARTPGASGQRDNGPRRRKTAAVSVPAGCAHAEVSADGATAPGEPHPRQRGTLIGEGRQVADDGGQTAWITDAAATALSGQPFYLGKTTQAGPLRPSGQLHRCQRHELLSTTVHG
jgi:hypothetical protein